MSSEFFQGGVPEQQFDEMAVRADIFYAKNTVANTLDDLAAMASDPDDPYALHSEFRHKQLKLLFDALCAMASQNDYSSVIDLDDPNLIDKTTMPEPSFLADIDMDLGSIIDDGELRGTNDFLSILAPTEVVDQTKRQIYYHPWSREVIEAALHRDCSDLDSYVEGSFDDALYITRPTRIANIEVVLSYLPNIREPQRILKVKRNDQNA